MRRFAALAFGPVLAALLLGGAIGPLRAEQVAPSGRAIAQAEAGSERFVVVAPVPVPRGIASYGPFRVLDATRAALVDATDERSPAAFTALLAAYPGITTLELIECPGTDDDRANLRLGRMIRARGLATHVPGGGSVRSGAVELFLAGLHRSADPGAEFAVHAWADERGREPKDYAASAPENRSYLDYYREMGMSPTEADAFYAMTNSVPNAAARWMSAAQMAEWVRYE
ncbi:MAG: alpha/beta hydrolase [Alphaproteobacteria bacterium]|nr:alpha/beta hydrolase [Alphaproteobacteria bacterium]